MCMTHGHELKRGIAGGKGGTEQSGAKGKNWDNCNSIINKIYLKKKKKYSKRQSIEIFLIT